MSTKLSLAPRPFLRYAPAIEERQSQSIPQLSWRTRLLWAAFGILAAAIPITAFLFGVHVGKSEYKPEARPAVEQGSLASTSTIPDSPDPALQNAPTAPAAPEKTPSLEAPEALVPARRLAVPSSDISWKPTQATRIIASRHAGQNPDDGQLELATALAQVEWPQWQSRFQSRPCACYGLPVAKGNTSAAVILADLFIAGDGVEKNCQQGKSLLTSASSNGNAQAKVKLDELNANGCP